MLDIETMEFLKKLFRPIYFLVYRLRGYPGIEVVSTEITEIINEYDDVFTYKLTKPQGLHLHAGYYAHVIAPNSHINNHDVQDMSLATAPHEDHLMITMDTQSNTRYKRKFKNASIGDHVNMYSIKGDFTNDHLNDCDRTVYIAGGIGITAIRSLICNKIDKEWRLIYAGKGYCYQDLWNDNASKVSLVKRDTLYSTISEELQGETNFYICGSGSFVEDVQQFLSNNNVDSSRIKAEGFGG